MPTYSTPCSIFEPNKPHLPRLAPQWQLLPSAHCPGCAMLRCSCFSLYVFVCEVLIKSKTFKYQRILMHPEQSCTPLMPWMSRPPHPSSLLAETKAQETKKERWNWSVQPSSVFGLHRPFCLSPLLVTPCYRYRGALTALLWQVALEVLYEGRKTLSTFPQLERLRLDFTCSCQGSLGYLAVCWPSVKQTCCMGLK